MMSTTISSAKYTVRKKSRCLPEYSHSAQHLLRDMCNICMYEQVALDGIEARLQHHGAENSATAATSVMEFKGRPDTPTAILECSPISPNMAKSRSDAASITL